MASGTLVGTMRHLRELFDDGTAVGLGDAQLLARYAASRDESAFAALVARHGPMVLATCRAVLRHDHDVEDAFQATFLVLARKARSVRAGEALGGRLHRVAYRIAIQALGASRQRRRREEKASAMSTPRVTPSGPEPDLAAIVHEELDRLPEKQRLPVVLCDLEGLTYEQAAGRLRWSEPTLRHRLVKARHRLRERLTRRGVTAGALALVLASPTAGAKAAVPAAMARAAVAAAAGGTTPATAAALAGAFLRGLLLARLKLAATGLLAAIGLVTLGVVAVGSGRPDPTRAAGPSSAGAMKRPAPDRHAPAPAKAPIELIEVRGWVVDPEGKPVPGATVRAAHLTRVIKPDREANTGPDGRFVLRVPPRPRDPYNRPDETTYPWVVASAPGFGIGWAPAASPPGGPHEATIRLVEDDPIEGRIVDLEGRPVADARIKVNHIRFSPEGRLAAWLDRARGRDLQGSWEGLDVLPVQIEAATGPDGRFRLLGIGRDRIARSLVSGPRIVTAPLDVVNRDGPVIHMTNSHGVTPEARRLTLHARRFEYVAAHSRPVEGVIRDRDTGRPIAGLALWGMVYVEDSRFWLNAPSVAATTDDEGRYRLAGLPIAPSYRFRAQPGPGQPYPEGTFETPAGPPSLGPARFDVALKRGIVVRGRLTDRATGRPILGAVTAYTFADNPHIREFPGYEGTYQSRGTGIDDGRFEIVTPPGRGIIAAHAGYEYRRGVGAAAIRGYRVDPRSPTAGSFDTRPQACYSTNYHVLAEVDLDPAVESVTLDLQADPGRSLTLHVLDPEGRPLGGTAASGLFDLYGTLPWPQDSPTIEVRGLDPSRPRRAIVRHEGRKLIGSIHLGGDESGSRTLELGPGARSPAGPSTRRVGLSRTRSSTTPTTTAGNRSPTGASCRGGTPARGSRPARTAASASRASSPASGTRRVRCRGRWSWAKSSATSSSPPARSRTWAR
jgi:RNA polymerase sigma factor (sigma-70 family)